MALEELMARTIRGIAKSVMVKQVVGGIAVNVSNLTCDVDRGEDAPMIYEARLNAIDDELESYVTVVPKEGSHVLAAVIENMGTEAVIIACSEVEKVIWKIDGQTLVMDKDGVVWNGGDNAGMVKIRELERNLKAIKDYLAVMDSAIQTGITNVGVGSSASGATGAAEYVKSMAGQTITFREMENPKIKH